MTINIIVVNIIIFLVVVIIIAYSTFIFLRVDQFEISFFKKINKYSKYIILKFFLLISQLDFKHLLILFRNLQIEVYTKNLKLNQ